MEAWKSVAVISTLILSLMPATNQGRVSSAYLALENNPTGKTVVTAADKLPAFHPSVVGLGNANDYTPPNFSQINNASQRKEAFYEYLVPMIHKANQEIILERRWLLALADRMISGQALSRHQLAELVRVERRYAIYKPQRLVAHRIDALLLRVDVVPASLVVAQAAKESGWGTSRFATEGNNFFGIWCFYQGCGLKPLRRNVDLTHEVATFGTVEQGVRYYVRTINSHSAYDELRSMRASARKQAQFIQGEELANGLIRYSERGSAYVQEVQSMIRYNNMQRFTRIYQV